MNDNVVDGVAERTVRTNGTLLAQITLARAIQLARQGLYARASELVGQLPPEHGQSCPALDLRARLAAQQGDLTAAKNHWNAVLRQLPDDRGARDGLSRIAILERARIRFMPSWQTSVILLLGAVVLVGALRALVNRNETTLTAATRAAEGDVVPSAMAPAIIALPPVPGVPSPSALSIDVPGIEVEHHSEGADLRFRIALFDRATQMTDSGAITLDILADQLASLAEDIHVRITGHTDSVPIRPGGGFVDNVHLGMARAVVVAELVRRAANLPAEALSLQSAGAGHPPFGSGANQDSALQRTVSMRITYRPPTS